MSLFSRKKKPADEIPISRLQVLDLKEGDIVLLHTDRPLPIAQLRHLRGMFDSVLPEGTKLAIMDRGLELEVIRPEQREIPLSDTYPTIKS